MGRALTWDDLARATLRRQFPRIRGRGTTAVVELFRRVGPVQSQVARAPFVTVSSRLPGADHAAVTRAYEELALLRGSSIRGTVHTGTTSQHAALDGVSRRALAPLWRRALRLVDCTPPEAQAEVERFATGAWRTPGELRDHLAGWLDAADPPADARAVRDRADTTGRSLAFGHGVLLRRPTPAAAPGLRPAAGWDRQAAPVYRSAVELLPDEEHGVRDDADAALVWLVRQHLAAFGPATRRDAAWWTGEGLGDVDAALATLAEAEEVVDRAGPDGARYWDLRRRPPASVDDPGVRLLPEFDGLLLGYDPKARRRFVADEHVPYFWLRANGMYSAVLLADGRLRGSWRFAGPDGRRRIEVRTFPGERLVDAAELVPQVAAVEAALDLEIVDVDIAAAPRR